MNELIANNLVSNDLVAFDNSLFGSVRTMIIEDKPYFLGKDIAQALGYKDPSSTISKHCKHIKKTIINVPCQNGNVIKTQASFIPEGDVFRLIIRSKLPQAEAFEEWVMEDVLPQIRQSGVYITKDASKEAIDFQSLYGKNRIYDTFINSENIQAEYEKFSSMSKIERKSRRINNDIRIECCKLIQKAISAQIANNLNILPASQLLAMRELSEKIQKDITEMSNRANGGFKSVLTKKIKAQEQQLKFMELELVEAKTQYKTMYKAMEDKLNEYENINIQEQGEDAELIEINYHGFSNNSMYDYSGEKVTKTNEYKNWIRNFPKKDIVRLSKMVDFTSPMACELYFDHNKCYDVHNFIKPMLDMITRVTGKDDKNIRQVSCVTNEFVKNHRRDGKIYIKLYNIEL